MKTKEDIQAGMSKISWCHFTYNPWIGCAHVSPGCEHCYAELKASPRGRLHHLTGDVWGVHTSRYRTKNWRDPRSWNALAAKNNTRYRVFCASLADVFDPHPALPPWRAELWTLIEECTNLDWLLLTKRPENIAMMVPPIWLDHWPKHVIPGTSAEDQRRVDERLIWLTLLPAPRTFVSAEPLLEDINLSRYLVAQRILDSQRIYRLANPISWVITGAESGPGARPMDEDWVRHLRDQCENAGTAFFYKQKVVYEPAKDGHLKQVKVELPELDGVRHEHYPQGMVV